MSAAVSDAINEATSKAVSNAQPAPTSSAKGTADGTVVLALNSGSSSLKFGLYRVGREQILCLLDGQIENRLDASNDLQTADGIDHGSHGDFDAPLAAMIGIVRQLADAGLPAPQRIGHRIVHGGPHLHRHGRIDYAMLRQMEEAAAFAPLHAANSLAIIRHARSLFPGHPQVACFDTVFHAGMPPLGSTLPLPKALRDGGIRRYGFHGLSCESVIATLGRDCPPRVVIAHLGNGVSVTAVRDGRSVDTSMGLTPNGGALMGTRSGDLDPGVLLYLLNTRKLSPDALAHLIDRESGLHGLSGVSSDLRRIHAAADRGNPDAAFAIAAFCLSVARQIAAMIVVLDGIDLLVFTAGIGEHDAAVRLAVCRHLRWIGVNVDALRNTEAHANGDHGIENAASRCKVRVIACREDEQIARHTADAA